MNVGDKFPNVLGLDSAGKEIKLSDYNVKGFIIYFYPKDSTPGCTAEACNFRDNYAKLGELGYQVIGVSKDSAASHVKFAEKNSLPFPLISDTDQVLCELAGVWQEKNMCGKKYMGIVRTTFITDSEGVVTDVIKKVKTKEATEQVCAILEGRG